MKFNNNNNDNTASLLLLLLLILSMANIFVNILVALIFIHQIFIPYLSAPHNGPNLNINIMVINQNIIASVKTESECNKLSEGLIN